MNRRTLLKALGLAPLVAWWPWRAAKADLPMIQRVEPVPGPPPDWDGQWRIYSQSIEIEDWPDGFIPVDPEVHKIYLEVLNSGRK